MEKQSEHMTIDDAIAAMSVERMRIYIDARLSWCSHCRGSGEIFEDAIMSANPYSYGDYDEIWVTCESCPWYARVWRRLRRWWYERRIEKAGEKLARDWQALIPDDSGDWEARQ